MADDPNKVVSVPRDQVPEHLEKDDELPDPQDYEKRKAMAAKETEYSLMEKKAEAMANIHHGMFLLGHTSWWMQWRAFVLGVPTLTVAHPKINTAAVGYNPNTGRVDFYFDLYFALKLSAGDISYILAHEAFHIIYDHIERMKRFPMLWNIVTDAFINTYLDKNVNWGAGVKHMDRQDYILKNGVRWTSLPEAIQKQFPVENIDQYSADEVYHAMLEHLQKNDQDPEEFEELIRKGKQLGTIKIENDPNSPPPNIVRQAIPLKVGDPVYCKTKGKYGFVKKINRSPRRELSEVEVEFDDSKSNKQFLKELFAKANKGGKKP
jgi:hypothetical protein